MVNFGAYFFEKRGALFSLYFLCFLKIFKKTLIFIKTLLLIFSEL